MVAPTKILRDAKGAAALEFALLLVPTTALLLISLQTATIFFFDQALQTATKEATRQLMTGAAQTAAMTQAQFKNSVCAAAGEFNCNNLMVDVESFSSFAAINDAPININYNSSHQVTNTFAYSPGGPGDIVITRVMYRWPVFGGPLVSMLTDQADGSHLLAATVVFKNEPY
jgi:Flp pilus assembly protein TadG